MEAALEEESIASINLTIKNHNCIKQGRRIKNALFYRFKMTNGTQLVPYMGEMTLVERMRTEFFILRRRKICGNLSPACLIFNN